MSSHTNPPAPQPSYNPQSASNPQAGGSSITNSQVTAGAQNPATSGTHNTNPAIDTNPTTTSTHTNPTHAHAQPQTTTHNQTTHQGYPSTVASGPTTTTSTHTTTETTPVKDPRSTGKKIESFVGTAHGVGEKIRGEFNAAADRAMKDPVGEAKDQRTIARGEEEIRGGKLV